MVPTLHSFVCSKCKKTFVCYVSDTLKALPQFVSKEEEARFMKLHHERNMSMSHAKDDANQNKLNELHNSYNDAFKNDMKDTDFYEKGPYFLYPPICLHCAYPKNDIFSRVKGLFC